jgi:signal peptidase I
MGTRFELSVEFLDEQAYLIAHDTEATLLHKSTLGPFELGPDELFVVGDNRDNSHDSRLWPAGPGVPLDNVKGRAWLVWLSFEEGGQMDSSRIGFRLHGTPSLPAGAAPALETRLDQCLSGFTPPS